MPSFGSLLRVASRALVNRPLHAAATVLTLALGVGANAAVFGYVDALLLRPLPFPDSERLVRIAAVRGDARADAGGKLSALEVRDLTEHARSFVGVASYRPSQYTVNDGGPPEVVAASMNTFNLFAVLGRPPARGATWPASDDGRRQFAVVISDRLWRERLGADPNVVGRSIVLDSYGYTVLGVLPPGPTFPAGADVFRRVPDADLASRAVRSASGVARLRPGVTLDEAREELAAVSRRLAELYPETNAGVRLTADPLRDAWVGDARGFLALLAAAVALVLLVAAVNVGALALARVLARERELALRTALGAPRGALVALVLAEVVPQALLGGVAGIAVAAGAVRWLDRLVRTDRPDWMAVAIDGRVIVFGLVVAVAAALIAAVVPALRAAGATPLDAMREGGRGAVGGRRQAMRRRLVVAQVALSVVLVVTAGLMARSLARLQAVRPGFDPAGVLTLRVDPPWTAYSAVAQTAPFYRRALEEIARVPGVERAALTDVLPLAGRDARESRRLTAIEVEGRGAEERERAPFAQLQMVSPGYFETMRMPLRRGRSFEPRDDTTATPIAVVSEALARRLWPNADPVGRRVRLGALDANYAGARASASPWLTVVGVAADVRDAGLGEAPGATLYVSSEQQFVPEGYLVVRRRGAAAAPGALAAAVRDAVWRVDPRLAVWEVREMRARVADTMWDRRLSGLLLTTFGGIALVLAAVGLYAVVAYAAAERTREVGVRMALGATRGAVARAVVGDAARLAGRGLALGAVGALVTGALASGLLYGVSPRDPVTYLASLALLGAVTLVAAWAPAWRASRVDPVTALRRD